MGRTSAGFLAPFGVLFVFLYIAPVAYAIYGSLFVIERAGPFGAATESFAGLANYVRAFQDSDFLASIGRVLLFGIVQVPIMLGLALCFALLLDSTVLRLKRFLRTSLFLPYGVPGVIGVIMWGFLYTPGLSPVVAALERLNLDVDLLGPGWALWSIGNIVTWTFTGYNMIILYSALQAVDTTIYEAARVDGAGGWQIAWRIKVPMLRPALVLTAIFSIIGTLQLFTEPQVLSAISSGVSSNYTPTMMAFSQASANNYAYAATLSVILALTTAVLSFGFLKLTQRRSS